MRVLEEYQNYCKKSARIEKLETLFVECIKIIQYENFYDLSYMDKSITYKWKELYNEVNMNTSYLKVIDKFKHLLSGHLNRREFSEYALKDFDKIQDIIDELKKSRDSSYTFFVNSYMDFFSNCPDIESFEDKLICFTMVQSETLAMVEKFLKL